jgi:hypothetical protein
MIELGYRLERSFAEGDSLNEKAHGVAAANRKLHCVPSCHTLQRCPQYRIFITKIRDSTHIPLHVLDVSLFNEVQASKSALYLSVLVFAAFGLRSVMTVIIFESRNQ